MLLNKKFNSIKKNSNLSLAPRCQGCQDEGQHLDRGWSQHWQWPGLDMPVLVSTVLDEADLTTVLLDNHLAVSTEGLESICLQSLDGFKVPTFSVLL